MNSYARIKALQMGKKKIFRILLIIECIALLMGIAGLFGKDAVYEYGADDMTINFGSYSEEHGGAHTENSGERDSMVDFRGIALPRGTYRVQVHYTVDTDMLTWCEVTDDTIGRKNLRTNGALFFSGLDHSDFEMWLLRDTSELAVHAWYAGEGSYTVHGLTICQTNAANRVILFLMLCLFTGVNMVCVYWQYDKKYGISVKKKAVIFCLGLTILAASTPLMVDYMRGGGDLFYHLMRVEGIRDAFLTGQFPVRISPEWQQGYGYASPIFYGETVLYPAGLLRMIGFTVTDAYRIFMFGITVATVLIAYFSFKKVFGDAYIGVFCSMLYSLSIYRFYKTYLSGSWGECFGVMILPILLYGFWRVFTQDVHEESYGRSWFPLTVGFSLLVQSHLLTGEMAGIFTIVLCLVLWKKVFRWQTFVVLAKTVIYSILLSAWFLVPFADYMLTGDFVIHHVSGRTIQARGLFPAHLFFTYFSNGTEVIFDDNGMANTAPVGVGIAPMVALLILVYLNFTGQLGKMEKRERVLGGIAGWFAAAAMLMSLSLFPWDRIQAMNGVTATLISSIQHPNRFLTIANVCLTAVAGLTAKYVMDSKKEVLKISYFCGMIFLLIISSIHLMDNTMFTSNVLRAYNGEGVSTGYIAGGEYLPHGADASRFMYHDPVCSEGIGTGNYTKLPLGADAHFENNSGQEGKAAFSLLYYKGYRAWDADSGELLNCYAGDNFEVTVDIPAGYTGDVRVRFVSPWYWRAGEVVTVLTAAAIALYYQWKKRGRNVLPDGQRGNLFAERQENGE